MNSEDKTVWRERLLKISSLLYNRLEQLDSDLESIALAGIARHVTACEKTGCSPSAEALAEIIRDAKVGRKVYAHTAHDKVFVGNHANEQD